MSGREEDGSPDNVRHRAVGRCALPGADIGCPAVYSRQRRPDAYVRSQFAPYSAQEHIANNAAICSVLLRWLRRAKQEDGGRQGSPFDRQIAWLCKVAQRQPSGGGYSAAQIPGSYRSRHGTPIPGGFGRGLGGFGESDQELSSTEAAICRTGDRSDVDVSRETWWPRLAPTLRRAIYGRAVGQSVPIVFHVKPGRLAVLAHRHPGSAPSRDRGRRCPVWINRNRTIQLGKTFQKSCLRGYVAPPCAICGSSSSAPGLHPATSQKSGPTSCGGRGATLACGLR